MKTENISKKTQTMKHVAFVTFSQATSAKT